MNSRYRNPLFRELKDQLIDRSSRDERLAHAFRAEHLLTELEDAQTYPYESFHSRITRTRSESLPDVHISARDARHDLCQLVEDVSDSANLPVESVNERVLTVHELAGMFSVSPKTIFRWRQRGLVGRRFVIDGRKRLGFLRSSVDRFVDRNAQHVHRSGQFRHLTNQERSEMIEKARSLTASGLSHQEVVRAICEQTGRCGETVRATIRKHDRQQPGDAVWPRAASPVTERVKEGLYTQYRRGDSVLTLAKRMGWTKSSVRRAIREMRAKRISELPLAYVANPGFEQPGAEKTILTGTPEPEHKPRMPRRPSGVPAYLASLYEVPLLTARQEQHLFRKYNFLKYRAAELREQLDANTPPSRPMNQIEQLYEQAVATKNEIIRANLRLVVSIAKRYLGRQEEFFDLVSDGNVSLMRAVEKFDFALGFKFSTYASWAIKKNYARMFADEMRQQDRFRTSLDEVLGEKMEYRANPRERESTHQRSQRDVGKLLASLNERERHIITSRYGLDPSREPQTLKEVGAEFGVSKERIRQIEARAMKKLELAAQQESIESPAA